MALKDQLSFSAGEIDPILHDRTTLQRFENALGTARNVMISKTGTIMSRFGRFFFKQAPYANQKIRVYSPPRSSVIFEFGVDESGVSFGNLYDFSGNLLAALNIFSTLDLGANLDDLHITTSGFYIYVFKVIENTSGRETFLRINYNSSFSVTQDSVFTVIPSAPASVTFTGAVSTGYQVDYAVSMVINGQESLSLTLVDTGLKKPIIITDMINLTVTLGTTTAVDINSVNEVRIYQRPTAGGAFGFLGRTTNVATVAGNVVAKFTDVGADPDFGNGIQSPVIKDGLTTAFSNVGLLSINTGVIYQQRLILANFPDYNVEAIVASRPGYQNNFFRDFPYSADSALNFKAGTSGNAEVLRMIDSDGLVVFTTAGVFVSVGVLSPDNIALQKRGSWVIDETIPPLAIPGGLFFVDKTTSTVRQLVFSQELQSYDSVDQSIFSDHLFKQRTIKSWAYQEGSNPLLIVCFSDGTFATFTYSFDQQMKAWTRHDTVWPVEQVESTGIADTTIFVINKNGTRQIDFTIPRITPSSVISTNPESNLLAYSALMDGLKVTSTLLNTLLVGTDQFILTPVVSGNWSGALTLTCGTSAIFTGVFAGIIFRFFNPVDKTRIDLIVTAFTNNNTIVVSPSEEFPSQYGTGFRLYPTHTTIFGLSHLEGEQVSVVCDGDVISSPYNDNQNDIFTTLTVTGGQLTLPAGVNSAISIVGRPVVSDIKTLNITTLEQSPTTVESLTVNKLYVRTFESRGIFVDNQFPENKINEVDGTSVKDMQTLDEYYVPNITPIIGNRSKPPVSKRIEVTIPGTWETNGEMAFRQVDPIHFEILSIIADVEILDRSRR